MLKTLLSVALVTTSAMAASVGVSPAVQAASTGITASQAGRIVSEDPSGITPHILDGTVYSITQVGDMVVVGGTFTQVRNANSRAVMDRNHLLAFSATTGKVSTTFVPQPNGSAVNKVLAAPDGTSVYVGGAGITQVAGGAVKNLFRLDVADGSLVRSFSPAKPNGLVKDLEVAGGRLFVAGKFTSLGGKAQVALGTLNAASGAYDGYFGNVVAGKRNTKPGAVTDVVAISTDPADDQLVAVGNFTSVNGLSRSQIAKFDLSSTCSTLSPWSTTQYTSLCSAHYDTYLTDVEYATDGSYFIVSTTGAYGGLGASTAGTSGCDSVARFEAAASAPSGPTWTAYTGGDTTWTVEVTDDVVYAGGHMRWENNPTRGDAAGQGAVERTGIAALDPVNGMPYSWNPTRTRGVGVQDMLATDDGLYVGSDTEVIGHEMHQRVALLPLSGGKTLPAEVPNTLPADVYTVASGQGQLVRRTFTGSAVTSSDTAPAGPGWAGTVGAFMVDGVLYTATGDGRLTEQTFDGSSYGPPSAVDAADQIVPQTDWHHGDVPLITSLFYADGRVYFTKSNSSYLYYRGFEPESGVVGQQRFALAAPAGSSSMYSTMRGAFVADGRLYFATSTGRLYGVDWSRAGASGTPVQVSGPGIDAESWSSAVMFPYQAG